MSELALAHENTVNNTNQELHKYLCFLLGEKSYAVNILKVKELVEHIEITPLPMMPDFFWGAVNIRGRVVPVIDLSARLGMKPTELGRRTCFVIIEMRINNTLLDAGIVVDAVSQVADLPPGCWEPAPTFGGNINNEFVKGIGKIGERFVVMLNIDKALSMEDIAAFEQATIEPEIEPEVSKEDTSQNDELALQKNEDGE